MRKASELLTQARDLIAKGWTQHQFYNADPATGQCAYCATGALNKVQSGNAQWAFADLANAMEGNVKTTIGYGDRFAERTVARQYLNAALTGQTNLDPGLAFHGIVTFNDDDDMTQERVVALFNDAIELAKANGE